jgi:hypothetical protein
MRAYRPNSCCRCRVQKQNGQHGQHAWHNADQQLGSICCCMANESPHDSVRCVGCIRAVTVEFELQMSMSYEL